MKIIWLTGRKLNTDLASTTEIHLGKKLEKLGHNIIFISPSSYQFSGRIENITITHNSFYGLETYSASRYLRKKILTKEELFEDTDIIIVDWRFVPFLRSYLKKIDLPWAIIDRGPPAYRGFKSFLQKLFWKKSWIIANECASGGFVVSKKHKSILPIESNIDIEVIRAGVDNAKIISKNKIKDRTWKFVYSGTIEESRGLNKVFDLAAQLEERNILYKIDIFGDGPYIEKIRKKARLWNKITINGKLSSKDVRELMPNYNFGLMLMPKYKIWEISSPLKLGEYINAGLLVIGPKHSGNELFGNESWSLLSEKEDWVVDVIDKIAMISKNGNLEQISMEAIESSKYLDWETISKKLEKDLFSMIEK